jgi:MYXO-CTERM domain-containing protein
VRRFVALRRLAALFALLVATLIPGGARAYTVRALDRPACHEEMTRDGFLALVAAGFDAEAAVPLPASHRWADVASYLGDDLFAGAEGDAERFMLFSLELGTRFPDLRGASATDIQSLREIHRDPERQDAHFLRAVADDYAAGDSLAIARGEAFIRARVTEAASYLERPLGEQIVEASVFVELYGQVSVPVWAPAYYFGMAVHTIEDSFSHTVRSDDLARIRRVCNYIEAVTYDYDLERDGLRHSWAMDRCEGEAVELAAAAAPAFEEFLNLFATSGDDAWPGARLDEFFAAWMTLEPGCNDVNDYCGSKWVDVARTDPSLPVWDTLFGCGVAPGAVPGDGPWLGAALIFALVALGIRGRRRAAGGE